MLHLFDEPIMERILGVSEPHAEGAPNLMHKRSDVSDGIQGICLKSTEWKWHGLEFRGNRQWDPQSASKVRTTTLEMEPRALLGPRTVEGKNDCGHFQIIDNSIPPVPPAWKAIWMAGNKNFDGLITGLQVVLQDICDRLV